MNRCVETELLDELPPSDPSAEGSRGDLRRLNWLMGHPQIVAEALELFGREASPENGTWHVPGRSRRQVSLVELGAGDGDFLLSVAKRLGPRWQGTRATALDRQNLITADTRNRFSELGWHVEAVTRDVFDWCRESTRCEAVICNLFLHHFVPSDLAKLLHEVARRSVFFLALEPRRSRLSLMFSKLVGWIGCNAVTRHDAPASVRAGFRARELSGCWPQDDQWATLERPAGLFSHLFVARRTFNSHQTFT